MLVWHHLLTLAWLLLPDPIGNRRFPDTLY
ncbi:hypothetical protein SAMN05421772_12535 [Paracoccus saliphilus]|uniref:Uncharacterized protein n=1 Tax=Paracoccus saliphilus TaxID=405559 RepID=A0AA45W889_9RHOB|nr:hypothetical protein SAMN05421772_12535 [Paracoccus saliphilus]